MSLHTLHTGLHLYKLRKGTGKPKAAKGVAWNAKGGEPHLLSYKPCNKPMSCSDSL